MRIRTLLFLVFGGEDEALPPGLEIAFVGRGRGLERRSRLGTGLLGSWGSRSHCIDGSKERPWRLRRCRSERESR